LKFMISRPINGIPLNGREQLTENDGETVKLFNSKDEALQYLFEYGLSKRDMRDYDIEIEEYKDEVHGTRS